MIVAMLTISLSVKTQETKIKSRNILNAIAALALLGACSTGALAQPAKTADSCAELARLDLPEATITMADVVRADGLPPTAKHDGARWARGTRRSGRASWRGSRHGVGALRS